MQGTLDSALSARTDIEQQHLEWASRQGRGNAELMAGRLAGAGASAWGQYAPGEHGSVEPFKSRLVSS